MGASSDTLAQIKYQQEENERNRVYNAEQAEISRNWSTNERLAQQAYNTSERVATQDYNSPQALSKRLTAAGINPAVYFSGQGPSQVASQPQSSSLPSPATAEFSGGISPVVSQIPQLMSSFSDMAKAMSNLPYNFKSLGLLDAQISNMIQATKESGERTQFQKFQNDLNNITKDQQIKEKVLKVALLKAQKDTTEKQGGVFEQDAELKKAQKSLQESMKDMTDTQKLMLDMEMKRYDEYLANRNELQRADLGLKKGQTADSYASATEHRSGAELKSAQAEGQRFINSLNKEPGVKNALVSQIKTAAENAKKSGKMTDKQVEFIGKQCEQLQKATDNYEIQMWSGIINQTIGTVTDAVGEFTRFGMVKKFLDAKPSLIESGRGYYMNNDGVLMVNPVK